MMTTTTMTCDAHGPVWVHQIIAGPGLWIETLISPNPQETPPQ